MKIQHIAILGLAVLVLCVNFDHGNQKKQDYYQFLIYILLKIRI